MVRGVAGMSMIDPRLIVGSQTSGRGRSDLEDLPQAQTLPQGALAGLACPRCHGALRVLPGRLATRIPTQMVGCSACGFVGLREG